MTMQTSRPLGRILGLGFGLAIAFGTMVGVGILRLPGTVAAALGDCTLIILFWTLGGLYTLMCAVAVAELAAMIPETGGFRVYARRAFGEGFGFAIGWIDWDSHACFSFACRPRNLLHRICRHHFASGLTTATDAMECRS